MYSLDSPMHILFPLIAALFQATSMTLDKVILSFKEMNFKLYTGVSFPLVALFTGIMFILFRPTITLALFTPSIILLLVILIGITIINNLLFYQALQHDLLVELKLLDLMRNIPILVISALLFIDERNPILILAALMSFIVVIWSHWENHQFAIRAQTLLFALWSLTLASFGPSLLKVLLQTLDPITIELIKNIGVALILTPLFYRELSKSFPSGHALGLLLVTNLLTSIAWVALSFGYQQLGVIYTTLIFSLQPLLIYVASALLLKERISRKKVIAFFLVLSVITWTLLQAG